MGSEEPRTITPGFAGSDSGSTDDMALIGLTTALVGFALGVLTALLMMRQRQRPRIGGEGA